MSHIVPVNNIGCGMKTNWKKCLNVAQEPIWELYLSRKDAFGPLAILTLLVRQLYLLSDVEQFW